MEKLQTNLADFEQLCTILIESTKEQSSGLPYLRQLVRGMQQLSKAVIGIGKDSYAHIIDSPKSIDALPYYFINFSWNDQAKSLLILWRNILFEHQKAQILLNANKIQAESIEKLRQASSQTLSAAAKELNDYFEQGISAIKAGKEGGLQQIEEWSLVDNPQPVYEEHIQELVGQSSQLLAQYEKVLAIANQYAAIENTIVETINACEKDIADLKGAAQQAIQFIEENKTEKVGKITQHLKSLEEQISISNTTHFFNGRLEELLHPLPQKETLAIGTKGGIIQVREIDFERQTRQWLSAEILPLLYELWELTETIIKKKKLSLINIHNRVTLLAAETREDVDATDNQLPLHQPLTTFLSKTAQLEEDFSKTSDFLLERLATYFAIDKIYDLEKDFLPIPFQSTLNQYRKLPENPLFTNIGNWFKRQVNTLSDIRNSVTTDESLSVSERIVRVIENRTIDVHNTQYSGVFLTKGYIGEAFRVGRTKELQHFGRLVDQWKSGYRGSVMLSGKRFSGKTLFGDYAANYFFNGNYIVLSPNVTINTNGRKFTTTHNLSEALDFIGKNTFNTKALVWLDDLELWSDAQTTLSQNVRILSQFIDNHVSKLFFMVSMGNWTKAHLGRIHELNQVFQAEINLDSMNANEVHEAILVRHGATHKRLVDKNGVKISPQQLKKLTNKVYRNAQGNIGEALNEWAYFIQSYNEEQVFYDKPNAYILPEFINPDIAIVLSTLMREKSANEYQLNKLFGQPYKTRYNSVVQRLISVGVLKRNLDGWLTINDVVVNEIGDLLTEKNYLLNGKAV